MSAQRTVDRPHGYICMWIVGDQPPHMYPSPFGDTDINTHIHRDAYPSPLNYYRFPKSVCTSVNEVIEWKRMMAFAWI
jgi:hypothetical protein